MTQYEIVVRGHADTVATGSTLAEAATAAGRAVFGVEGGTVIGGLRDRLGDEYYWATLAAPSDGGGYDTLGTALITVVR